jgi:hypothetical protein
LDLSARGVVANLDTMESRGFVCISLGKLGQHVTSFADVGGDVLFRASLPLTSEGPQRTAWPEPGNMCPICLP